MPGERIGFTGHQGLTEATERMVAEAIQANLRDVVRPIGICSLAEGSDQIFAQALRTAGGDLVVVIPCRGYERTFVNASSLTIFHELRTEAIEVIELDHPAPSESAFWEAGKRVVVESDRVVAVWDGKPAGGLGGTADVVHFAQQLDKTVDVIWPEGASRT